MNGDLVLVTGGAGYIGSVLVPKLVNRGYKVRVLDRFFWGPGILADLPDVDLVTSDVRDIGPEDLDGVSAVIHLAGLSNDPSAEFNPQANWEMNALATERLASACLQREVPRLIFGSSCSVYDGLGSEEILDETSNVKPSAPYAGSKYYGERALLAAAEHGLEPVILRQATVCGFSPRMRYDLVLNTFVKDALTKGKLFLHDGGWQWRPLVDVEDLTDVHIACLEAPSELVGGQTFNVIQGNFRVRELAVLVAGSVQLSAHSVQLVEVPAPRVTRDYRCSGTRLKDRLGIRCERTPFITISDLLSHIGEVDGQNFEHPRFHNIRWMELLTEVHPYLKPFSSVF
jgi:nucleoside-diphosphate-sugar epimerase